MSPALAGRFLSTGPPRKSGRHPVLKKIVAFCKLFIFRWRQVIMGNVSLKNDNDLCTSECTIHLILNHTLHHPLSPPCHCNRNLLYCIITAAPIEGWLCAGYSSLSHLSPHNNQVGDDYWTYSTDEEAENQGGHKQLGPRYRHTKWQIWVSSQCFVQFSFTSMAFFSFLPHEL